MIKVLAAFLGTLGAAGLALVLGAGVPLPYSITSVSNTAALKTLPAASSYGGMVMRVTDGTAGASPMSFYASSLVPHTTPCALNGGAGDGASQVPTSDGNCWYGYFPNGQYDVREFGVLGNGSTDQTTGLQNAVNAAAAAGGGRVTVPAAGDAYVIATTVTIPSGVHLEGNAGHLAWSATNQFFDNTETDWTQTNTWLKCTSTSVTYCLHVTGHGVSIEHFNFWYAQTTPTHGSQCSSPCTFTSYTPTIYPWTIYLDGDGTNYTTLNDVNSVNAGNFVDWEGPTSGIGGIHSVMEHMFIGAFGTGTRFHYIDNTMMLRDLHYETLWYQGSSDWWNAMENGSALGWDVQYLANPIIENVEFSFIGTAIKFTDATVGSGFGAITFAVANMHAHGLSFNEVCQGMTEAASTTHVTGTLEGVTVAADTTSSGVSGQCENSATASQATMWYLPSNNTNLAISNVIGGDVQQLAYLGTSGGAQLHLGSVNLQQYSAFKAGGVALTVDSSGSVIDLSSNPFLYPSSSFTAGALCSGTGCWDAAQTRLGALEITTPSGTNGQLCLTNLPTPPNNPGTAFLGTQVFCLRRDTAGNFNLDRYVGGTYDESPIQTAGTAKAPVKFPETIGEQQGYSDVPILISGLGSCAAGNAGTHRTVSNGISSPTYGATVGTTGTITDPVFCNGSNWVYQ